MAPHPSNLAIGNLSRIQRQSVEAQTARARCQDKYAIDPLLIKVPANLLQSRIATGIFKYCCSSSHEDPY
jgi:hypothetical protein